MSLNEASSINRLRFNISRKKMLTVLAGCAVLMAACSYLAFADRPSFDFRLQPLGWAGLVLFGLFSGFALSRLVVGGPALVVEMDGITDFSSGLSAGYVRWDEIAGIYPVLFGKQRFLGIVVRDAAVLKSNLSRVKARAVDWNVKQGLPHILVPAVSLQHPVEEVAQAIHDFVEAHGLLSDDDERAKN